MELTKKGIILACMMTFLVVLAAMPMETAAYGEVWYEYSYPKYTANDYAYDYGFPDYPGSNAYWLHSEATLKLTYKCRELGGRVIRTLISTTWYKLEHWTYLGYEDGSWDPMNGQVQMYLIRSGSTIWQSPWPWTSHYVTYPNVAYQSGDRFRDCACSGAYPEMLYNDIIP